MKIVHVMECFAGGTFNFLMELTNELHTEQHIVIYGSSRENTPVDFKSRFPINTIFYEWKNAQRSINPIKDLKSLIELYKILKSIRDIDIIHLHSSKAGFLGRIAAFILGKANKVIYTTHAVSFLRLDVSKKKRKIFIFMEKIGSLFGGQVVACSKSEMEAIEQEGIKNVTYINNGIEPLSVKSCSRDRDKVNIISVGRLSIQKNPKLFNEIASYFVDDKNIQFIWCGDGELRNELKSPNIEITGWVDKNYIVDKLLKADIYLSTSLWEGLPLSVLEAMSAGLPVILSKCVGNTDLVQDNGIVYKDMNTAVESIKKMLIDTKKLDNFRAKSKELFYKEFTLKLMAEKYFNLYKRVSLQ